MSIVPGFDFDIFVSYAHLNNQKLSDEDQGWVSDFHKVVHARLWEELGKQPAIWRDERGLDGRMADPSIAKAIYQSAVLVVVMSQAYMSSPYCQSEVKEFCSYRHPAFDLVVRGFSRIVTVVYDEVSVDQWREELRNGPSVPFSTTDAATGDRIRYTKPPRTNLADPYFQAVDRVVRHLKAILQELQRGPTSGTELAQPIVRIDEQLPAYLAEATDDLQSERTEVLQLLERNSKRLGLPVYPARSIIQSVSVTEAIRDGLARANVSVHLINETAGRIWGDAGKPLAQLELEESMKRAGKPRPLVWISPEVKPESLPASPYRDFLQLLKAGKFEVRDPEVRTPAVFEMPFDRFLGQLETRLFPPIKAVARTVRSQQPGGVLVYISHKSSKPENLPPLIDFFRSRKCSVSHLDHGATGADVEKRHEANLRFCDGLVVLYGHEGVSWAETVALQARLNARQSHHPRKLGVFGEDPEAERQFGLIDDLMIPIRKTGAGEFEGAEDFLVSIGEEGNG